MKQYKSPILCFDSVWKKLDTTEKYTDSKGNIKYRPKYVLIFDINPEYRGKNNGTMG
jgi:hypothetical protein|tara:strand:- start:2301 stop:2471 length:171 start_codon:yes stop_codon:yes gene_type:complete